MLLDDNDVDEEEVETQSIIVQKGIVGGKGKDKAKAAAAVVEDEEEDEEESEEVEEDRLTVVKKAAVSGKAKKKGKAAAQATGPMRRKPRAICGAPISPEEDEEDDGDFDEEDKSFVVRSSSYHLHSIKLYSDST